MNDKTIQRVNLFDRVNLLLAICAIVISGASFYATYIQAEAAEKQVRAATWPLLQITSSNAEEDGKPRVSMHVRNAGVGPAHIKTFALQYKGGQYPDIYHLIAAHFVQEAAYLKEEAGKPLSSAKGAMLTSSVKDAILTPGEMRKIFDLIPAPRNRELWNALNKARWEIEASACYCSLLEQCYTTDFKHNPVAVHACPDTK